MNKRCKRQNVLTSFPVSELCFAVYSGHPFRYIRPTYNFIATEVFIDLKMLSCLGIICHAWGCFALIAHV